jgi:stringent starvation protein B
MSPERPSKQQAFLALLREGWTSLYLDARRPGVIVPAHLRGEAHLVLQYGHDLLIPIPDLEVDDYGVRATLSFSRTPHLTVVPWSAVYVIACEDGRAMLYHEDVPEDVSIVASPAPVEQVLSEAEVNHDDVLEAGVASQMSVAATRARHLLRSVPADPSGAELAGPLVARRRRRPQLRLVK